MKIYGLFVFFSGVSAIQGLENFQIDLIFKFDRVNDVNEICQNDSIWYNKSTAETYVQRILQAILTNSNVSVDNVSYQTEPGSWDIKCSNTSVSNVTNVAVLKLNLTTSISSGKGDVKSRLNNFWHGGWNYSVLSSIIGNKSHWIACGQVKDTESATKEPIRLHPLDCENSATIDHSLSTNTNQTTSQYYPSTATGSYGSSTQDNPNTTRNSSLNTGFPSNDNLSTTGHKSPKQDTSITVHHGSQTQDNSGTTGYTSSTPVSSSTVHQGSQSQDSSGTTGYTSSTPVSSSAAHQGSQSQDSSGTNGYTSSTPVSSSRVNQGSQSQDNSDTNGYTSSTPVSLSAAHQDSQGQADSSTTGYILLKQEQEKKDDRSNALAVGLGTGLGILALLVTLTTLLYRYFLEKNKVSDFSGIYGFPPETPRQSDRTGKSTFRTNMA